MKDKNELRDPIHGFIEVYKKDFNIINMPAFQRLRKVKQLAMAYLVYPGANHTRFDHSVGVYHLASKIAEKIDLPDDESRIVRLSALLHDIGHGPFSHISEDVLEKYSSLSGSLPIENIHEHITQGIIRTDKSINHYISEDDRDRIIGIISGKNNDESVHKEIVSGPLDADKMDYLLRDSYFCGVKYGVFDIQRLLNTINKYKDRNDTHIGVEVDGVNTLEQFVLAKYYMITQVYRHKVRLVSDAMIKRGLELGIEKDEIGFLKKLYTFEDSDEYYNNYLNYWDDRVISEILYSDNNGHAKHIFERLHERRLFVRIFSAKIKKLGNIGILVKNLSEIQTKENQELRLKIENAVSKIKPLKCDANYVIANSFSIQNVRKMSRNSEGSLMIIEKGNPKSPFDEDSRIFQSIDETMKNEEYFEIYAPLDRSSAKGNVKEQIENDVFDILKSLGGKNV